MSQSQISGQSSNGAQALTLPGAAGSYASTPDSVANSITGDIDIRVFCRLPDYTPAAESALIGKLDNTARRSYALTISNTGFLRFYTSPDGTAGSQLTGISTLAVTGLVTDGNPIWLRVTLDVNDGAGNRVYQFFTSTDGSTWSQLGTTVTTAGATSIADTTSIVEIGALITGTANPLNGLVYQAQIYNGINGTLAVNFTPTLTQAGQTSFVSSTGELWTLNGSARLV